MARNRTGNIGGLRNSRAQPLELLVDREVVTTFMAVPPEGIDHSQVDKNFISRVPITAGPHKIGVTFPKISNSLIESERQPLEARFNETRHPRQNPAVFQVTITGPLSQKVLEIRQVGSKYFPAGLKRLLRSLRVRRKLSLRLLDEHIDE